MDSGSENCGFNQVPVGGCYRLIDTPISNCINSGINKIFFNSDSLNCHLVRTYHGTRVNFGHGFEEVLAATQTAVDAGMKWFQGTADASWSEMTKGLKEVKDTLKLDLKSVKEVKDTVKLHLVKSLKEVKGKYADVDLENVVQRVAAPFIIIVGIWAFSSHTSNKLLVVSEEQTDHLRAIRCVLDKSYGVEEEKQIVGEEKEKEKNRDLPSLQLLDEQKLVFRKVVNAWKDKLVNAWEEPNISARDYAKIVYGTF